LNFKQFAIFLCASCILLLSGCGGSPESTVSSVTEPVAFGATEIGSTPEYAAETTSLPETVSSVQEEAEEPENAPESESALYQAAISAAVRCETGENLPYDPTDPMYFWRAMGYFIGTIGENSAITYADGAYTIGSSDIPQLAFALFGDFDGTIPSVTEEDPLVSLGENDTYVIHLPELEALDLRYSELTDQGDGTYSVTAELYEDGTLTASYTATLRDYGGS
jgi:hypothetical protein